MRTLPNAESASPASFFLVGSQEARFSVLLVLLIWVVFGQVVSFDFVNIDDQAYVTENQFVREGLTSESVNWALTSTESAGFWQPLVWLSLKLDVEMFGTWPGGFHVTNVLLHTANTLLLFRWLCCLTGSTGRSFFVAALFAVHPLHVESVAWITERKDVLSTFFGLVSLASWLRFTGTGGRRWYLAAWLAMAASLMSKQMLVTLPFVLLLLDYWPLRRTERGHGASRELPPFRTLVIEKLPFLLLTFAFCGVAWLTQSAAGATKLLHVTPVDRLANAVVAYAIYLRKTVWPHDLAVFYPHPGSSISTVTLICSALLLLTITAVTVWQRDTRRYLLVGWLWFAGTLVLVIGIVQVGHQQMADRFMYFPLIGLALGLSMLVPTRRSIRFPAAVCGTVCVLCFAAVSFQQVQHWRNSVTLSVHGLAVTDNNWMLDATLAAAIMTNPQDASDLVMAEQTHLQLAEVYLRKAIDLRPDYAPAHLNLGLILSDYGQLTEANECFRTALRHNPEYYKAQSSLCTNLRRLGDQKALASQLRILEKMERVQ